MQNTNREPNTTLGILGIPIIFARQETRRTHFHDFFFGVGVVVFGCVGFFDVLVFLMCWFFCGGVRFAHHLAVPLVATPLESQTPC